MGDDRYVTFSLGGIIFEYDESKNQKNIEKHGISFYATNFERGLYYGKYE